jgi:hypothetical protein
VKQLSKMRLFPHNVAFRIGHKTLQLNGPGTLTGQLKNGIKGKLIKKEEKMVEELQFAIWANSKKRVGSLFSITLKVLRTDHP